MFSKRFFFAAVFITALVWGALLTLPTRAASLTVSTLIDVVDSNDGLCSLREAVIATNTNTASGAGAGECPAGSDTTTDLITLENSAVYLLEIAGPDEDASATGDLDIVNNTAEVDVEIVAADAGVATIDGNGLDRVLHISSAGLEMTGITLTNGDATVSSFKGGGNLFNDKGAVILTGGQVMNGTADVGGGLYNYSSNPGEGIMSLTGTQVMLNEATNASGGIFSGGDDSSLTLSGASVRANTAVTQGGGISVSNGVFVMENESSVSLNTSNTDGGGISAYFTSAFTVTNSLVEANTATNGNGGGIYLEGDSTAQGFFMENAVVSDNIAGLHGGGIFDIASENLHVYTSTFSLNVASDLGGAIRAGNPVIIGGTFDGNQASRGGAIGGSLMMKIENATFTNNSAVDGGALYTQFLEGNHLSFQSNHADGFGGGAYVWNRSLSLQNSTFSQNTAGVDGGGIYHNTDSFYNHSNVISGSLFHLNTAGSNGGAFWTSASMNVVNSTVAENTATSFGGGVFIAASGLVTTTHTTLAFNQANGQLGSGLYNLGKAWMANTLLGSHAFDTCYTVSIVNLISLGNNLSEGSDCNLNAAGDQPSTPAGLVGAVQDNGGPTWTWALDPASTAVNAGNFAYCASVDQRGFPRIDTCDIGAFEVVYQVFLPLLVK